jgi:hypothetical protein
VNPSTSQSVALFLQPEKKQPNFMGSTRLNKIENQNNQPKKLTWHKSLNKFERGQLTKKLEKKNWDKAEVNY